MRRSAFLGAAVLATVSWLAACPTSGPAHSHGGDGVSDTSGATDTPSADGALGDVADEELSGPTGDGGADLGPAPSCDSPELRLGTHPTGDTDITKYVDLGTDDELCVELGTQGFLMVVYGFRSRCGIDAPFELCVDISRDGAVLGDVCLKKQEWVGDDGQWSYYLNVFLVVASTLDEFKAANAYYGETATLSVRLEDADGDILEQTKDVVLIDCWGADQLPEG